MAGKLDPRLAQLDKEQLRILKQGVMRGAGLMFDVNILLEHLLNSKPVDDVELTRELFDALAEAQVAWLRWIRLISPKIHVDLSPRCWSCIAAAQEMARAGKLCQDPSKIGALT